MPWKTVLPMEERLSFSVLARQGQQSLSSLCEEFGISRKTGYKGVEVEYIRQGKLQDNGSHERMHRTLRAEATRPPSPNRAAQRKRFDRWVKQFTEDRPHEALGMQRPAQCYRASARRLSQKDNGIRYPRDHKVHQVSQSGFLCFEGQTCYLGETLAQVGLCYNQSHQYEVYFASHKLGGLGRIDSRSPKAEN